MKLRRFLFAVILRELEKNPLQPRRGGMVPLGACHAAPMGLRKVVGVRGGYKHVAPPELAPCRLREREVAGSNHPATGKAGIASLLAIGHHCPGLPEPGP